MLHIDNNKESAISRAKELSLERTLYVIESSGAYYVEIEGESHIQPWENLVAIAKDGEIKHLK